MKIKVRMCERAELEHEENSRQFAHVFHHPNEICVAHQFYDLPQIYRAGILLHELGHLAWDGQKHNEGDADRMAFYLSGVKVLRRAYRGHRRLEVIQTADMGAAVRYLRKHLA
jgi:hypothetical protein